jgi:predicted membrane chloride channel (bestrophin family)
MGVKNIKANLSKRNLSYNIVNIIGGKYLRALKRPNKSRKYNNNSLKDRNNKIKRLLGGCSSK